MSDSGQRVIYVFPGQGSQYQGIGSDLYAEFESARLVYQQASDVLGYDMAELCFDDDSGALVLARIRRPSAIDVESIHTVRTDVTDADFG